MFSLKFLFLFCSCYACVCSVCHLNLSLSLLCILQTFALSVTGQARTTNAALVSIFEMQEAAIRPGKILPLPMTASLPSSLASFLSYIVFAPLRKPVKMFCNQLEKYCFFSKDTVFGFSIVRIQNLFLFQKPSSSCLHSFLIHFFSEQEPEVCFDATDSQRVSPVATHICSPFGALLQPKSNSSLAPCCLTASQNRDSRRHIFHALTDSFCCFKSSVRLAI